MKDATREEVLHISTARVILVDYPLIRKDFPEIAHKSNAAIDAWIDIIGPAAGLQVADLNVSYEKPLFQHGVDLQGNAVLNFWASPLIGSELRVHVTIALNETSPQSPGYVRFLVSKIQWTGNITCVDHFNDEPASIDVKSP